MSLLSQFFPSGSGGIAGSQKVELLLVGGGGGGGASGGMCTDNVCDISTQAGIVGGGGGGGQVVFSDGYEVIQDVSYPITVGAGGAGGGFYYDTTNVYYPCNANSAPRPVNCYPTSIQNRNAGTLRGANGGNTIFGSVVFYGGGGGGGGMSNSDNYLPSVCCNAAIAVCSQWTAKGADGGTGGGSGSGYCGTGCITVDPESPNPEVKPGNAIYNSSTNFLKLGQEGPKFKIPSNFPSVPNVPTPQGALAIVSAFSILTYATGGGGNSSASEYGRICLKTPRASVCCMTAGCIPCFNCDATSTCPGGQGYYKYVCSPTGEIAAVNAFMEGTIGDSGAANQYNSCNDFSGSLRGGDGYETTMTPSPEYYGGGGGVVHAMGSNDCAVLAGAIISPGSPCYPSPSWCNSPPHAWMTCPYGGKGGGGAVCTPLITRTPCNSCFCKVLCSIGACDFPGCQGVGVCQSQCGADLPVPGFICPGAGIAGCGGGGSSFHGGCGFASTGDVFPNAPADPGGADSCAFCGFAGGSGTVVIRYPTVFSAATVTGNTPITPQSGYHIYRYNGPGTITFPSS